jgi:hypothetical protein
MRWPQRFALSLAASALLAAAAWAGPPFPPNCRCTIAICPAGDLQSTILVRDSGNLPVPFANVQIQFGGPGIFDCAGGPPHSVMGQTDATGTAHFNIAGAGASVNGAIVFANGTPICNGAPVAGPDLTGNGIVDNSDMQLMRGLVGSNDRRADFTGDGLVTAADTLIANAHLGHGCIGSYQLLGPAGGTEFNLVLPLDGVPMTFDFANGDSARDTLAGEITLEIGPRISPSQVHLELGVVSMFGGNFVGPGGSAGYYDLIPNRSGGPIAGTWSSNGTFSFAPFRALLHSGLADSVAAIVAPDTVDVVPVSGDSVTCTLAGTIAPTGDHYTFGWTMSLIPDSSPSQYLYCADGHAEQSGKTGGGNGAECPPCKTLCIVPVICADDNGANPGCTPADMKALLDKAAEIWNKCCVVINQGVAIVNLNSTALNTWGANDTPGTYGKRMRDALSKKQADGKPLVPDDVLKACIVVSALAHGAGPDGGGETTKGGKDVQINPTHLKTRCPGGAGKPDPDSRVVAHELGHVMGLPQNDKPGPNLMDDCAPGDNVGGQTADGDEGGLSGDCATVHESGNLIADTSSKTGKPVPCFKLNGKKPPKCTVKLTCKIE